MPNDETYETHSVSWNDIADLVRKYWKLVLIVFVFGILGTYSTLQLFFTTQYETKTKLLVKVGRENAELPPTVLNGQVLNQGVRLADINSEVELLSARSLVEEVVDEMGPGSFRFEPPRPTSVFGYPKYLVKRVARWGKGQYQELLILANIKKRLSPREKAIVGVSEGVAVEPIKESDVLLLKVRLPSAELSSQVSTRLLRYYMEERAKARRVSTSPDLFQPQLAEQRERLQSMLEQRQQVRKDWHLSSAEQQRGLLLQELTKIHQEIIGNAGEIAELQQQRSAMSAKLEIIPEMLPKEKLETRNPALQSIKERLTTLQIERAKLASGYQPDSEMMKRTNSEMADLEATLARESPTVAMSSTTELNPVLREFKAGVEQSSVRIEGLTKRNDDLRAATARITADLDRVNRGGDAYETLEREYRVAENSFIEYSKKQEDARISEALDEKDLPNVVMMGLPETPIEPVSPRQLFILGFALPVSLLMGIALAALCESFDDHIRDERSLASLDGINLLGSWRMDGPLEIAGVVGNGN
jgi:uncharacterized protein involved in exopolysaccharide biosynthesis